MEGINSIIGLSILTIALFGCHAFSAHLTYPNNPQSRPTPPATPLNLFYQYRSLAGTIKRQIREEKEQHFHSTLLNLISHTDAEIPNIFHLQVFLEDPDLVGLCEEVILIAFSVFNCLLDEFKNTPYGRFVPLSPVMGVDQLVDTSWLRTGDAMDGQLSTNFEIVRADYVEKKSISSARRVLVECFLDGYFPPELMYRDHEAFRKYFLAMVLPNNQQENGVMLVEAFYCPGSPKQLNYKVYLIRRRFRYIDYGEEKSFYQLQTFILDEQNNIIRIGFSDKDLLVFRITGRSVRDNNRVGPAANTYPALTAAVPMAPNGVSTTWTQPPQRQAENYYPPVGQAAYPPGTQTGWPQNPQSMNQPPQSYQNYPYGPQGQPMTQMQGWAPPGAGQPPIQGQNQRRGTY